VAVIAATALGVNGFTVGDAWIVNALLLAMVVVFTLACAVGGDWAEARWRRKDPSEVVADEVAGQAIALLLLPWQSTEDVRGFVANVLIAATAFIAFRLFDIIKPPPAGGLQRVPGGWGIVLDDLAAGVYAMFVVQLTARLVWVPGLVG
jgi:phosphatidylglycerophosphatase A